MNLEINNTERQILLTALIQFHKVSTDSRESAKIGNLINKVENLIPEDRRIAYMDEEGNLYVDGVKVTESDLGL